MKSTVYAHLENDYRFYRLPLFRATAVKYGWDNPMNDPDVHKVYEAGMYYIYSN